MMAIIDRLEARGLVARSRSKRDRRRQDLHLTPVGTKVLAEARAAVGRHEAWLKDRVGSPEQVAEFVATLKRIYR
jgi:DNA-binding MarR family transcriptional regulator